MKKALTLNLEKKVIRSFNQFSYPLNLHATSVINRHIAYKTTYQRKSYEQASFSFVVKSMCLTF